MLLTVAVLCFVVQVLAWVLLPSSAHTSPVEVDGLGAEEQAA